MMPIQKGARKAVRRVTDGASVSLAPFKQMAHQANRSKVRRELRMAVEYVGSESIDVDDLDDLDLDPPHVIGSYQVD